MYERAKHYEVNPAVYHRTKASEMTVSSRKLLLSCRTNSSASSRTSPRAKAMPLNLLLAYLAYSLKWLTRKRNRASLLEDELLSDREKVFDDAEKEVEDQATDANGDFRGGAGQQQFDIQERRRRKGVIKRLDMEA
jgi:hypothetical protein